MVEVIGVFGIVLFGLLTLSYGASIRGKTCWWKEREQFWSWKDTNTNENQSEKINEGQLAVGCFCLMFIIGLLMFLVTRV